MMDSGDKRGKLGERPRAKCTVNGLKADQTQDSVLRLYIGHMLNPVS